MSKHKDHIDADAPIGTEPTERQPKAADVSGESVNGAGGAADVDSAANVETAEKSEAKPEAGAPDERDTEIQELNKQIQVLSAENADLKDQYLRKAADYENFRKRMAKEKEEAVNFANSSLLLDLIGVVDNFDRALHATDSSSDPAHLRGGIEMIESQMLTLLENKWGLARFSTKGSAFDPDVHEAIAREDREDIAEPTVVDEFLAGYRLHGRVIRTAKVKVGMPKPVAAATGTSEPAEQESGNK
jgi:molecular chaperone GrpE